METAQRPGIETQEEAMARILRTGRPANSVEELYGPGPGPDDQTDHDAESLMNWVMGKDNPSWSRVGEAVAVPLATTNPWSAVAALPAWQTIDENLVRKVTAPAVGGPLYPPILGVLYTPLGLFIRR